MIIARRWRNILRVALLLLATVAVAVLAGSCPTKRASAYYSDSFGVKANDIYVWKEDGSTWATAHDAASGTVVNGDAEIVSVANNYASSGVYHINRGFMVFDTSGLPDSAVITGGSIELNITAITDTTAVRSKIYAVSAGSYPTDPPEAGDYDISHYGTYGGSTAFLDEIGVGTYAVTLNSTGYGFISKTGITRIALVESLDYADIAPGDGEKGSVTFDSHSGSDPPTLYVDYVLAPTVTSSAASSIGTTTATANGNITDLGGDAAASYRGCVYDTSSHGDPGNVAPLSSGYGYMTLDGPSSYPTGAFTQSLSGLSVDTDYYYRTWVATTWGYDYSNTEQTFHTYEVPGITCSAVSSITNTTARLPGNVTDAGYPASDTVVVYWGDDDAGTVAGNWDHNSAPSSPAQPQGSGAYYKDVTGLSPGGTYYWRAAATNTGGTTWASATVSWATTNVPPTVTTTAASSVTNSTATVNGTLDSTGGDATCDYWGLCWDNVSHGAPGNVAPASCGYDGPPGTGYYTYGPGAYSPGSGGVALGSLTANTVYYFRFYAHNSSGWVYGAEVSFETADVPYLTAEAATGTIMTTTYFHGTITDVNGASASARGFDYGETLSFGSEWTESGSFSTGAFTSAEISGLTPGTKYYFRAKAQNTYGWGYSSQTYVVTIPEGPTDLTIYEMTYTTIGLAWLSGDHAQKTMVRYGYDDYPATPADGTEGYNNSGDTAELTSLIPGQSYYIRAWSWCLGSDVWSDDYDEAYVVLPTPEPISLKAKANDAHTVNLLWTVDDNLTSVSSLYTIIMMQVGEYPADPPGPGDTEIYNELTGPDGAKNYIWTNASAGTPYFFTLWYYNSLTDNYSEAVRATCTTPAGYGDPTYPDGSDYFNDPDASGMADNPADPIVASGATIWGFEHGIMWAAIVMLISIIVGMYLAIETRSGLITTFGMMAVMIPAGAAGVCPYWVSVPFAILGLAMTWVASKSYG